MSVNPRDLKFHFAFFFTYKNTILYSSQKTYSLQSREIFCSLMFESILWINSNLLTIWAILLNLSISGCWIKKNFKKIKNNLIVCNLRCRVDQTISTVDRLSDYYPGCAEMLYIYILVAPKNESSIIWKYSCLVLSRIKWLTYRYIHAWKQSC